MSIEQTIRDIVGSTYDTRIHKFMIDGSILTDIFTVVERILKHSAITSSVTFKVNNNILTIGVSDVIAYEAYIPVQCGDFCKSYSFIDIRELISSSTTVDITCSDSVMIIATESTTVTSVATDVEYVSAPKVTGKPQAFPSSIAGSIRTLRAAHAIGRDIKMENTYYIEQDWVYVNYAMLIAGIYSKGIDLNAIIGNSAAEVLLGYSEVSSEVKYYQSENYITLENSRGYRLWLPCSKVMEKNCIKDTFNSAVLLLKSFDMSKFNNAVAYYNRVAKNETIQLIIHEKALSLLLQTENMKIERAYGDARTAVVYTCKIPVSILYSLTKLWRDTASFYARGGVLCIQSNTSRVSILTCVQS